MKLEEYTGYLRGPAFLTNDEALFLSEVAERSSVGILEIGSGYGGSTVLFLSHAPEEIPVISVDPFIRDEQAALEWQSSREELETGVGFAVLTVTGSVKRMVRWAVIELASKEVFEKDTLRNYRFDMIFIDGSHYYDDVKLDVDNCIPRLSRGGLMILHDSRYCGKPNGNTYLRGWLGPTRVAEELKSMSGVSLEHEVDSITAWRIR